MDKWFFLMKFMTIIAIKKMHQARQLFHSCQLLIQTEVKRQTLNHLHYHTTITVILTKRRAGWYPNRTFLRKTQLLQLFNIHILQTLNSRSL